MPYLDGNWMSDRDEIPAGMWIPETNWDRWSSRGRDRPLRQLWDREPEPYAAPDLWESEFAKLRESEQDKYLEILGRDIGSVQRDGLFYSNFVERLKNSPSDSLADEIVNRMQTLGFVSAMWPYAVGGPPPHESPRPWKTVLDWLLKLLSKVGKFLLNAVAFTTVTLRHLGLSAVAVSVGWPLSVSFEFPPDLFRDPPTWNRARMFLDNILTEMGDKAFAP